MNSCVPYTVFLVTALVLTGCAAATTSAPPLPAHADRLDQALTATPGDPNRGREIVVGRDANCLFCHAIPETGERFMGNIAPPLTKVGTRLTAGEIRLRVVDPTRVNPDAVMPAYHRTEGLNQVAESYRGKPVLTAQQVEDVVAYLLTLK